MRVGWKSIVIKGLHESFQSGKVWFKVSLIVSPAAYSRMVEGLSDVVAGGRVQGSGRYPHVQRLIRRDNVEQASFCKRPTRPCLLRS